MSIPFFLSRCLFFFVVFIDCCSSSKKFLVGPPSESDTLFNASGLLHSQCFQFRDFFTKFSPVRSTAAGMSDEWLTDYFQNIAFQNFENARRRCHESGVVGAEFVSARFANGISCAFCLPQECLGNKNITTAAVRVAIASWPALRDWASGPIKITYLSDWSKIKLNVAIVGYARAGTSALFHHLVFNPQASRDGALSYSVPGVWLDRINLNANKSANMGQEFHEKSLSKIIFEDWWFNMVTSRQYFVTRDQAKSFNADFNEVSEGAWELYLRSHGHYTQLPAHGTIIKAVTHIADQMAMHRLLAIPRAKFIVMIPDLFRWFDREISSIIHLCDGRSEKIGRIVALPADSICVQQGVARILSDNSSPVNILNSTAFIREQGVSQRFLFLHHEALVTSGNLVMRDIELFLGMPPNSTGDWPASPRRSSWRTNLCSSGIYPVVKQHLLAQYPYISKIISNPMLVPRSIIHGHSSCDEF